jgi:nicotinic acid mononucleotide adenylyltransferase
MAASAAEVKPIVVNSYQGAFGPPTLGHYQAMKFAAEAMLRDFPDRKILMLFMPTAAGSAKPHLALTQDERIAALNIYCDKLQQEISDPRIKFEASRIEYDIYNNKKSTATILTLEKLRELYPKATLCLTMGLDNLFDLPFWNRVEEYSTFINTIYVPDRDISSEDIYKTEETTLNGIPLRFNKFASWDTKEAKPLNIETVKHQLEGLNFHMLGKPAPTSSSLLRIALLKYYGGDEIKYEHVKKLEGREAVRLEAEDEMKTKDPWYMSYLKTNHLEKPEKIASFNTDYAASGLASGGARSSPSNRMTTKHHYESTVKGTMAWANSELEHVGRIASIKDKDLQYSYALSTVNGMAHLRDALYQLVKDPNYRAHSMDLLRTHDAVIRVMKHLIREYKVNLDTIRMFNTRKVLTDFSYLKNAKGKAAPKATRKANKSRRGTRRSYS